MKTIIGILIIITLFVIIAIVVLIPFKEIWNKHKKASNDIANYNSTMTSFAYKTPMTKQEIISAISMRNVKDDMEYEFDKEKFTIKFSRYGEVAIEYKITIIEAKKFSIVKVTQNSSILTNKNRIHLLQNPFWTQKLKAEPVPYHTYFK